MGNKYLRIQEEHSKHVSSLTSTSANNSLNRFSVAVISGIKSIIQGLAVIKSNIFLRDLSPEME